MTNTLTPAQVAYIAAHADEVWTALNLAHDALNEASEEMGDHPLWNGGWRESGDDEDDDPGSGYIADQAVRHLLSDVVRLP